LLAIDWRAKKNFSETFIILNAACLKGSKQEACGGFHRHSLPTGRVL
jgi:hypothetical protein